MKYVHLFCNGFHIVHTLSGSIFNFGPQNLEAHTLTYRETHTHVNIQTHTPNVNLDRISRLEKP